MAYMLSRAKNLVDDDDVICTRAKCSSTQKVAIYLPTALPSGNALRALITSGGRGLACTATSARVSLLVIVAPSPAALYVSKQPPLNRPSLTQQHTCTNEHGVCPMTHNQSLNKTTYTK